ncbi:MAG: hypothetical protein WC889_02955 [Myxococcota bacterium]
MVAQVDSNWIEWNGGARPVAADTIVQVKYRPSHPTLPSNPSSPARADWFHLFGSCDWWRHASPVRTNDIIAYRVVQS